MIIPSRLLREKVFRVVYLVQNIAGSKATESRATNYAIEATAVVYTWPIACGFRDGTQVGGVSLETSPYLLLR